MLEQTIGERINSFLEYKRSLGYVYDTGERYLKHYQKHMELDYPSLTLPNKESTDSFLDNYKGQSGGLYNAMAPLREFSRYLLRLGYNDVYLIPPKQIPKLHPEPPYFISEEEVSVFFNHVMLTSKFILCHLDAVWCFRQNSDYCTVAGYDQKKQGHCL